MAIDTLYAAMLAEQCAARHRTPKATVTHPKGVIVPGSTLLTENIRDPDYVPYCGPCDPMQRMRRNETGFYCPTCLNKTNWDLSKFNGNADVQFDPEYADMEWVATHQAKVQALKDREAKHKKPFSENQDPATKFQIDWSEDAGKKNTHFHPCNKCGKSFFGKKSRKYCVVCNEQNEERLKQQKMRNDPMPWK
jgi:hypothetical protein